MYARVCILQTSGCADDGSNNSSNNAPTFITCPTCRKESFIPPGGVAGFQVRNKELITVCLSFHFVYFVGTSYCKSIVMSKNYCNLNAPLVYIDEVLFNINCSTRLVMYFTRKVSCLCELCRIFIKISRNTTKTHYFTK